MSCRPGGFDVGRGVGDGVFGGGFAGAGVAARGDDAEGGAALVVMQCEAVAEVAGEVGGEGGGVGGRALRVEAQEAHGAADFLVGDGGARPGDDVARGLGGDRDAGGAGVLVKHHPEGPGGGALGVEGEHGDVAAGGLFGAKTIGEDGGKADDGGPSRGGRTRRGSWPSRRRNDHHGEAPGAVPGHREGAYIGAEGTIVRSPNDCRGLARAVAGEHRASQRGRAVGAVFGVEQQGPVGGGRRGDGEGAREGQGLAVGDAGRAGARAQQLLRDRLCDRGGGGAEQGQQGAVCEGRAEAEKGGRAHSVGLWQREGGPDPVRACQV